MQAISDIFGIWPNVKAMSEDIGEEPDTVLRWTYRGRIPERCWSAVIQGAARKGKVVTVEELHAANAPIKQRGYPTHKKQRRAARRKERNEQRAAS